MPSPFPGMDPYLEGELWQEFHQTFASEIRRQLNPKLRPKYVALLEKYFVTDESMVELFGLPTTAVYPDVAVAATGHSAGAAGALELTETAPTAELPTLIHSPRMRVEIRDVAQRRLVTVIEILSRANKFRGGAHEYRNKRDVLLQTMAHLLELDLLRAGERAYLGEPLPSGDYYVYLNRQQQRERTTVWAITLPGRLPVVPVPLLAPDPDVLLDVQAAFTASFDVVGYDLLIDYQAPPPAPELPPAGMAWLDGVLRAAGRRATQTDSTA